MNKKKRTKIVLLVIAVLVVAAALWGGKYLLDVNKYQNAVKEITYSDIDIRTVPNGVYTGECDVDFIYAKVEVTVTDGSITNIVLLEHRNDRGGAATGIEQRIVEQQQVDVDAVSGATNSSKVIKKAVDNALNSAVKGG